MTELDKAVARIRAASCYRLLVLGYRLLLLGPVVLGLAIGSIALWRLQPPVVFIPISAAFGTVLAGVILAWAGMLGMYAGHLMPRGGTNRHSALMRALWKDVIAPVRRTK